MKTKETFITKYKPVYIEDFHFKPDFLSVLNTLFEMDDINILFIGSPNSGKTSLLYAIIRKYYGLSKTSSLPENNIMFINNLKEQGINYFRTEMKTFCQSHSTIYGKKKMIIIDDMDTISEQCQQVFRNYFDKYRHNVNFVSVCTNIQKIIESIQSRYHIMKIPKLTVSNIKTIMNNIIEKENIKIDKDSKEYLIQTSENSIRNIINNLEKIFIIKSNDDDTSIDIDLETCKKLCSTISYNQFEEYINALCENENFDIKKPIKIIYSIHNYGYSVIDILDTFFSFVKYTDLLTETQKYKIITVICKYTTIFHNIHEDAIELALFTNEIYKLL
jgi:DNA polymerase III delta prime subunit